MLNCYESHEVRGYMNNHQIKSIIKKHLVISLLIAGLVPAIVAILKKNNFWWRWNIFSFSKLIKSPLVRHYVFRSIWQWKWQKMKLQLLKLLLNHEIKVSYFMKCACSWDKHSWCNSPEFSLIRQPHCNFTEWVCS